MPSDKEGRPEVHISPDAATCDDCLAELFDPTDRRYCYPFINCTNCGPRLTIITDIPYDRKNTSMHSFPLCEKCRLEYSDPRDRRFHAEPNACPECGPVLSLCDRKAPMGCPDPIEKTTELLGPGTWWLSKSLGGFHLCADASSSGALIRLRERKYREEKPWPSWSGTSSTPACWPACPRRRRLLAGPERPIVLLRKKESPSSLPFSPGHGQPGDHAP